MIIIQLLVLFIGLLMYALAGNPKLQEIGKIMFAAGLLSFLLSGHVPYVHTAP